MKVGIEIPVAIGDLIDKITILQIKSMRITQSDQLKNIQYELSILLTKKLQLPITAGLHELQEKLQVVNEKLWQIEDELRYYEAKKQFGEGFVQLARSVYITNDLRCQIKKKINILFGSEIIEEKSYQQYR